MVAYLSDRSRRTAMIACAFVAFCGAIAAYAITSMSGTKTGAALGIACTLGPALLYVAIITPIAFPFGLYALLTPFDNLLNFTAMGTLTRLLGIASAAALLFYMIRAKRLADPDRSIVLWLLLFLWTGASLFWAQDATVSMELLPTILQLFGLYAVVSMMRIDAGQLRIVAGTAVAGGALAAGYSLYLYRHGMANFADRLWLRTDTVNLNPDNFAAALLLPVSLAIVAALWTRSLLVRIFAIASLAVMLPTIFLSGSRGAELAFLVVVVYLIIRDKQHRARIGFGAAALIALGVTVTGPSFISRWTTALSSGGAGRTDIWKVGWIAFKQNWLFGAGYNNFKNAYDHSFIQAFQPLYANWHRAPHNILLGTGVELGIIGIALLLLGWYGQFRLLRTIEQCDPRFPLRLGLEAALIALFICGQFADLMPEKYLWLAFMLVVLTRNAAVAKRGAVAAEHGEPLEQPAHA